jgi:hypothetical protein
MIEIKAVPGKLIMLGKQGENLAREVIFDVSGVRAEFGDGTFRLSAKRPGEADAYPATVTETGDTVVWALTGADTQNAGRGQCELAYYAGETRLKTWTYDTAIAKSLTGSPKTDPYDEFLDEVNRLAAEAAISQREAKNSETAAKTSEDNAATYAQAALAAEKKSEQNAENAASAATAAGQYAQNAATSATNAASSVSAAETHEKGAKDAAAAAAKSAEGLADAVKRAEDAATSAQDSAGKTAADREAVAEMKTAAETAAETATEKAAEITDSAAQIATNTENIGKNATGIKTNATDIDLLRRENVELKAKTDALWKLSEGKSYDFVEDSTEAYSKNVPSGCRFAQVERIGGKTAVWNQWVDETKYRDATSASVTATTSGRRIIMAGTSGSNGENFNMIDRNTEIWSAAAGHYYLFAGINKLTGLNILAYNDVNVATVAIAGSTAKNAVFKPAFSGASQLYFNTAKAGVAVDVDCAPYLIDLTQLFGSGNEPTAADDPRIAEIIAYAEKHPEYNAGELVSAGVEDVEAQGANLIKETHLIGVANMESGYVGVAAGEAYTLCSNAIVDGLYINAADGSNLYKQYGATSLTFVPENNLTVKCKLYSSKNDADKYRIWLVKGRNYLMYSEYSLATYPIPDAVKALPGYGWSAGNLYNEIVRRADGWDYVQRVGLPATTDGYTALDTPTTTDITDLMTGALPLLTTEPGGTITMHHALADGGLRLDVPNTVKFIRDLKEVASSGTE